MADCAAIPSCAHLKLQRTRSRTTDLIPRNVSVSAAISHRQHISGRFNIVACFPSTRTQVAFSPHVNLKESLVLKESSLRCFCLGTLTSPENLVALKWVPLVDQMLLVASIVLAYMGGVIPNERISSGAKNSTASQESGAANSTSYGRYTNIDAETSIKDSWGEVRAKLADALDAIERDGSLDRRSENYTKRRPLYLSAIFESPRLRLLWATLQQLQKEVNSISQTCEVVDYDGWLAVSSDVVQGSIQPICTKWLQEELAVQNVEPEKRLFSRISAILEEDGTILQITDRLGKAELYAELLYFLRFGSIRTGCYYDSRFLALHRVDILEDLLVTVADGIASIYLELISVDSNMSNEMNGLGITLCSLSTRLLQRLRNEAALNQWLQQNFESVVSMYDDRFELFIMYREQFKGPQEKESKRYTWWKKFAFEKPAPSSLYYIQIKPFPLPLKRTKELRALTGWKYYFSLCLEFYDITLPLVRIVFSKVQSAVSFFLVSLIGRSLGLIYSGIRQSLGWR